MDKHIGNSKKKKTKWKLTAHTVNHLQQCCDITAAVLNLIPIQLEKWEILCRSHCIALKSGTMTSSQNKLK